MRFIQILVSILAIAGAIGLCGALRKDPSSVVAAIPTAEVSPAKVTIVPTESTHHTTEKASPSIREQVDGFVTELNAAMNRDDKKSMKGVLQNIAAFTAKNPTALDHLIARLRTEPNTRVLSTVGRAILQMGSPENQKAMTDAALDFLLSEDTTERRIATLEILASTPAISDELRHAVSRVSHEDPSGEVKLAATAAMQAWAQRRPDLFRADEYAHEVENRDAALVPITTDLSNTEQHEIHTKKL